MLVDRRRLRIASRKAWYVWGLAGVAMAFACGASIETKKVPSRVQYSAWTDDKQKEADEIQGFRYYLPRPYIIVKREFPWATRSIVVPGAVSADGKYILLDPKTLNAAGLNAMPDATYPVFANGATVAASGGGAPAPQGNATGLQGSVVTDAGSDAAQGGHDGGSESGGGTSSEGGADGGGGDSGASDAASSFAVTGSSTDHTVTLSDYMDLLYGPDFDEQYAVKPSGGISKADFAMQLGNGWMAESVNAHIDNTAVGSFIFDQLGKTFDLARNLTKLIPGVPTALQGAVLTADAGQPSSQKALVKITTIEYVVPGLYPIYKPRELMECVTRSLDAGAAADGGPACSSTAPIWGDILRFHTRTDVVLQLVTTSNDGSGASGSTSGTDTNSAQINGALKTAAENQVKQTAAGVTMNDVVGDVSSGQVNVTLSCSGYANATAAKAAKDKAAKVLIRKIFQSAMPSAKTVAVTCDNGM
jgi:uncharacterized membrane protein YgcG